MDLASFTETRERDTLQGLCDLAANVLRCGCAGFAIDDPGVPASGSAGLRAMDPGIAAALVGAVLEIARGHEDAPLPVGGTLVWRRAYVGDAVAAFFALFANRPPEDPDHAQMVVGSCAEIAAEMAVQEKRRRRDALAHAMLRHIEEIAHIGAFEFDPDSGRFVWSDEVFHIHGLDPPVAPDLEQLLALSPPPAREKLRLEFEQAAIEGRSFDLTTPVEAADGRDRTIRTIGRARLAGGRVREIFGTVEDVTRQIDAEQRTWWAANHDPVTALPNRLLFDDRLTSAIQRSKRQGSGFAIALVGIRRPFATARGPSAGITDREVVIVATRLGAAVRESDTLARVSADEFAILLNDIGSSEMLEVPLRRVVDRFLADDGAAADDDASAIHTLPHDLAMSCGVALFPKHGRSADALLRAADLALLRAKARPDLPYVVYDRTIAASASKRRESILDRARESLERNEFVPYYQPQVDIETSEIVGAEALVRWKTPDLVLDAKDFAFALNDHEIGSRVSAAILGAVIEDIEKLKRHGDRPFRVSVNASRTEVLRNDFLETFLERTRQGKLRADDFIIEITEDVIIGIADQKLHDKISYLASSGVEFSLDDFGTGYASLIHITSFPIKEIKIDKQFITGIEHDRRKRAIVRGIVSIARSIGLHVIAEGVETYEQEDVLRSIGCRYAQGYLYSFPLPFDQFAALFES